MTIKNSFKNLPNEKGYFGSFGGRYVSETLMPLILEVEKEYEKIKNESKFKEKLNYYFNNDEGKKITETEPAVWTDAKPVFHKDGTYFSVSIRFLRF